MANDDFDLNYDYEQELGFDPKSFLGDTENHEDIDLDAFSDEELLNDPELFGSDPEPTQADPLEDELGLDLDGFLNMGDPRGRSQDVGGYDPDPFADDPIDVPQFAQREDYEEENDAEDPIPNDLPEPEPEYPPEEPEEVPQEKPRRERRERPPKEPKKPRERKSAGPNLFTKFYDLYFAPVMDKSLIAEPVDPNNPRRRRRKSKAQIFKEVYLPPIVACACMILVFSFVIGSLSNFIKEKQGDRLAQQSQQQSSLSAQQEAELRKDRIIQEAQELATVYDYDGAIAKLEEIDDLTANPDIAQMRADYDTARSQLREYPDASLIPNLSFHPLMVDPARAFKDEELGGQYNRNFVSTTEFSKLLDQLYASGYVLVDFDSFTTKNNDQIFTEPIRLPEGKKPIMITETMVNYYHYMVDKDRDCVPDQNGVGFAHRLVVDGKGDIKAEYIDGTGANLTGDYDLVPILESFLKVHPDFSYKGARAILAVSGKEGIFGYRINSSYVSTKGQQFQDEQIAGAKKVVEALRDKGYTFACYTFDDTKYKDMTANQIGDDLSKWAKDITPVLGDVDVFVFAKESDITDYTGAAYEVMHNAGFRYFVSSGNTPWAETKSGYVRQKRLMVTGNTMAWKKDQFANIFDPNLVIDMTTRVSVPN